MTSSDDQNECPLCMEPLEVDDSNFYPCTCGYQICRFCWHRLKTDGNGLCPACRKPYSDNPAHFEPLSEDEIIRIKKERRQKEQQKKQHRSGESRLHLADVRVVQKNLVFVVGLSQRLADAEVLKKNEYFGRFGKILKVVINQSPQYAGSQIPSASAYLTYSKADEALRAIQTVNNIQIDSRTLKASLGTTKYCSHFLKSAACPKHDCMYLHDFGEDAASFTKEEMSQGKHLDYECKLIETVLHIPKSMQNVAPVSGAGGADAEAESAPDEHKKSRTRAGAQRAARASKGAAAAADDSKPNQTSSTASLTVNTNTDLISCSSMNNLNTQSSSSSSSSSSLTPSLQPSHPSQQASPVHHAADTNNNTNPPSSHHLDLNAKNLLDQDSIESSQTSFLLSQQQQSQKPFSSQNSLFHEEDLGFDPLGESLNALQDLMQSENCLNSKNGHTNGTNYAPSRPAAPSLNQNTTLNPTQLEYLQKQLFQKSDLSHTTFPHPSLESLLSLQHNSLLANPLAAPLPSLSSLLHLNHKPNGIVPPPGFANTKLSSSSTPSSNSTSTNSSASSSVNNSASSTPSMNNFVQNKNMGSNGNLHALKSIFPNANISFGNNFVQSNQANSYSKNMASSNSSSYWPDDPAIISLTDHIAAANNPTCGIGGLSDFSSNLSRSLSPAIGINGSQSSVKSSFYDNFSSLQNSYPNYQNYENIAKLQQLHQFMMQQQQMNNSAMDQAHQHQLQMIKSLQNSNQNYLSNSGYNSLASLQQQLLMQQFNGFQMQPNSMTQVPTATKSSTAD